MIRKIIRRLKGFKTEEEQQVYKEAYRQKRLEFLKKKAEIKAKTSLLDIKKINKGMETGMNRLQYLLTDKEVNQNEKGHNNSN